jgi:DNA-binding HxlR family transcriptional regulator
VRSKSGDGPSASTRTAEPQQVCPHYHRAVELIGRRWAGAILYTLTNGPMRFADVKESVPGMSDRLLSQRLKELEQAGLVRREVQPGSRVQVSYELTKKGQSLEPAMGVLRDWARRWHSA